MAQVLTDQKGCWSGDAEVACSARCQLLTSGLRGCLGAPCGGGQGEALRKGVGSVAFYQNRVFQYFNDWCVCTVV